MSATQGSLSLEYAALRRPAARERRDPIAELVVALERDGKPPLAWVVAWGAHGEPVAAAWAASTQPRYMVDLLRRVDLAAYRAAVAAWQGYVNAHPRRTYHLGWIARAVRRAVPTPPTLAALLAAGGAP